MMRQRIHPRSFVIAALVAAGAVAIPSLAQVKFSQLDTMLKKGEGQARSTNGASQCAPRSTRSAKATQTSYSGAFDEDKVAANIDKRLSQLRALLQVALSRRMLNAYQVAALHSQLDLIQAHETRYKRMGLTPENTSSLVADLEKVRTGINRQLAYSVSQQRSVPNAVTPVGNLENERLYLQDRITQGVKLGRVSDRQAKAWRAELAEVAGMERQPGGVTPREQAELRRMLAQIDARISKFM